MLNRSTQLRSLGALAAVATVAALAPEAHAAGFAAARFGGPHGNPTEANPAAIYYNPAGLAGRPGTRISLDVNWALRNSTYERDASAVFPRPGGADPLDVPANTGEGSVNNFIYSPMVGVSSDFGTDIPFAIGAGFFAPFGGKASWDQTDPVEGAPGAVDGPQRWYTIDGEITTLAIALGGAYRIESIRLSIGLAANVYLSTVDTVRARTPNGEDYYEREGRSYISVSGTDFGLGFGVLAEPIEDTLWIGASYQSRPGFNGKLELEGTLQNVFTGGEPSPADDVVMTSQLPDIFRLGVRYRPIEDLELRLFGDYTRWSAMTNQCVVTERNLDGGDVYDYCDVIGENGGVGTSTNIITLNSARDWHDAGGVRLGGSYWLLDDKLELMLDLGFDGNAIPDESLEPALFDMNKYSVGAGVVVKPVDFMSLTVSGTNIFYAERDTTGVDTANRFVPPTRQPNSAGIYNQNIFVLNTAVGFEF